VKDRGPWCQTFTGVAFYPFDPAATEVHDMDIAHALSLQCRFGGHCREFYSVAEHCVRVSHIVPPNYAREGLLHDAAEAYLIDLPRPIKLGMPEYSTVEKRIAKVIGYKYGAWLDPLPDEVKLADEIMLATEKRDLMAEAPIPWAWLPEPHRDRIIKPLSPREARAAFLNRMSELALPVETDWRKVEQIQDTATAPTLRPSAPVERAPTNTVCGWHNDTTPLWPGEGEEPIPEEHCDKPAGNFRNCTVPGVRVCAEHKCRCRQPRDPMETLDEGAR
jgi:5'-nucleotidase